MFNFAGLSSMQNAILSIGLVVMFLVGVIWGMSGKKFAWEARVKPYLLPVGLALTALSLIIEAVRRGL